MKGQSIIIPESLQKRALDQLHVNHMDKGKGITFYIVPLNQTV